MIGSFYSVAMEILNEQSKLLRSKSTHITVVSTEGMIARELRNATDRYIDLNDIRVHIEKVEY